MSGVRAAAQLALAVMDSQWQDTCARDPDYILAVPIRELRRALSVKEETMTHLAADAALCLWEEMTASTNGPWEQWRDDNGACALRGYVIDIAQACSDDWHALNPHGDGDLGLLAFDWEFCPVWIRTAIDWASCPVGSFPSLLPVEARRAAILAAAQEQKGQPQLHPVGAVAAIAKAIGFVEGFEGDETQQGIPQLLADLRAAKSQTAGLFALAKSITQDCVTAEAMDGLIQRAHALVGEPAAKESEA